MLANAGVHIVQDAAQVDEDEIKRSCRAAGLKVDEVAEALAETKAQRVSGRHRGALVIGADQMLELEDLWLDKPEGADGARRQLQMLRGKTHRLISCAVVVRDGDRLWHHTDMAQLTVRPFSDAFLDRYLTLVGDGVLTSVGGYQLEGLGAQLFTRVQGDFFTVLGLPLLPLLDFLRMQGALDS